MYRIKGFIFLSCLFVVVPQLSAQENGTVSGSGIATIQRQPNRIRVSVTMQAKGKDLKEALQSLKDRKEASRTLLDTLGAIKDSVSIDDPKIDHSKKAQQGQMQQLIMQRTIGAQNPASDKLQFEWPLYVSADLVAEWSIEAENLEAFLIAANELTEKIKKADLGGTKDMGSLSPQEKELQEEMQQMQNRYGGYDSSESATPGEPSFVYVVTISEEEHVQLLKKAFDQAKKQAGQLAEATGSELGKLFDISSESSNAYANEYQEYGYGYRQPRRMPSIPQKEKKEAIGMLPGKVSYGVSVSATFNLK